MKPEEKSQKSRAHILEYAFAEFADQGYLGASVNTICTVGKISKGLLYHGCDSDLPVRRRFPDQHCRSFPVPV